METVLIAGLATAFLAYAWDEKEVFEPLRYQFARLLGRGRILEWLHELLTCRVCMSFWFGQGLYWIARSSIEESWGWDLSYFVPGFAAGAISALWVELLREVLHG